jgi:hypothetical protein
VERQLLLLTAINGIAAFFVVDNGEDTEVRR